MHHCRQALSHPLPLAGQDYVSAPLNVQSATVVDRSIVKSEIGASFSRPTCDGEPSSTRRISGRMISKYSKLSLSYSTLDSIIHFAALQFGWQDAAHSKA